MRTCSKCSNPRRTSGRYCKLHHAEAMRKFRKETPLTADQRRKMNCRSYANTYQCRGKLKRQPCQECGTAIAEKHHPDYSKPLEVIWLCRPCHLKLHKPQP